MKAAVTAAVVLAIAIAAAGAAQSSHGGTRAPSARLDGTWIVQVTRENPPPGLAPGFMSLMTFEAGGGMLETSNTGTSLRGPAHGEWIRTGPRRYATSMVFFRFDPATGAFTGTQRVHRGMRLSADLMRFTAVSVADQFDPQGNLIVRGLRATETGERLAVEPLPISWSGRATPRAGRRLRASPPPPSPAAAGRARS